jgi:hypothetical protein
MKRSAATVMLEILRKGYRLRRSARTGRLVALTGADAAVPLTRLVGLLDYDYYEVTGRAAPPEAATRAIEILAAGELPIVDVGDAESTLPPEVGSPDEARAAELRQRASRLRESEDLLGLLDAGLRSDGFAGDTSVPRLVYLAACSALLDIGRDGMSERMTSVKVDGASSSGKNFAVDAAVAYLPDDAVIRLTGMSQKALIYGEQPLARKFLYFPEGAGIRDDSEAAILLRSLLSEGELRYEVAVPQPGGAPATELIVRTGPTAAFITTSAVSLDRDLDNRLLRATIDDSEELTRRIIERHGDRAARGGAAVRDRSEWHALFEWRLTQAPVRVRIPFAPRIAELIPASAVRLRRDAQTVFTLTAAHAALHSDLRERDDEEHVIATTADYSAARDLLDPILGASVEHVVPAWARDTWDATPELPEEAITYAQLGRALGIGTDAARTRALRLEESGEVINLESRWKRPAKLTRGNTVPGGMGIFLPRSEDLDTTRRDLDEGSRSPEHTTEIVVLSPACDRPQEQEHGSEPSARTVTTTGADDGSGGAPASEEPRDVEDASPRSGDLDAGAPAEVWRRNPEGTCHHCGEFVGEDNLTHAKLYGGRLKACGTCLDRVPSIRPATSWRPPQRHRLGSVASLEFDRGDLER